ncbi:MAG TPA: S4 domain-containing protein, partial [Candidatus Paceibacterota bacterium]|nr:S4 domain-containing protein [Candidatus Paceibacterota bacterium]
MDTRINKYIAESGLSSRRAAENYIRDGVVTINGKVVKLGAKVKTGDIVKVNG